MPRLRLIHTISLVTDWHIQRTGKVIAFCFVVHLISIMRCFAYVDSTLFDLERSLSPKEPCYYFFLATPVLGYRIVHIPSILAPAFLQKIAHID